MPIQVEAVALLFFLMGALAFVRPRTYLLPYFGVEASTPDSRNEIQAVYGGFGVAIAAILLLPIWMPEAKVGVLIAVAGALCGMAGGRVIAALREKPGRWPIVFFFVELAGAAILLSAL